MKRVRVRVNQVRSVPHLRHPVHLLHPQSRVTESEGVISPEAAKPDAPDCPGRDASRTGCFKSADAPSSARASASRPRRAVRLVSSAREASLQHSLRADVRVAGVFSGSQRVWLDVGNASERSAVGAGIQGTRAAALRHRRAAPEFVDLTVPSDAVLGLQIERTVSSELARVEDKVDARVTRDVRVSDRIAIPAGSTVRGSVTEVESGGRMKGKARLAIRFHTIVLADGTQVALKTDPVVREGQSPGGESAAKVGGAAIGGAILGAILGGGKGAAIGGAVGAAGGTAAAMTNDRNPATLAAGTTVTVRMQAPVTVTVQKE